MSDLFGRAIIDYLTGNSPEDLVTETSISEEDEMSVAYLFRSFDKMPLIEQRALLLVQGKTLDIGCGAGSHSLYLQNKGIDVSAIDISPGAVEGSRLRGIKDAECIDFMEIDGQKFDTILLLMNGTGICGKLSRMPAFLTKLKSLLNPTGQILIDSSDIIYMFDDDEDGGKWIPGTGYYGEVTFTVKYKGEKSKPFDWLYVDFNTLANAADANGLNCELVAEGPHYDYLARLTHSK